MGAGKFYYRAEPVSTSGSGHWSLPPILPPGPQATVVGFEPTNETILQKGDRIQLYIVNYNPVAHSPGDATVAVIEEQTAGPLIGALLQVLLGGTIPVPSGMGFAGGGGPPPPGAGAPGQRAALLARLKNIVQRTQAFHTAIVTFRNTTDYAQIADFSARVASVPDDPALWTLFDNQQAWNRVVELLLTAGLGNEAALEAFVTTVYSAIQGIETEAGAIRDELLTYDLDYLQYLSGNGEDEELALLRKKIGENLLSILGLYSGDGGHPIGANVAKFLTARKSYVAFKAKLKTNQAGYRLYDYTVQVNRDALGEAAAVRFDIPFKSPNKDLQRAMSRSLVLRVEPHYPAFIMSVGVAINGLKLKEIKTESVATEITDTSKTPPVTTVVARDRFVVGTSSTYNKITPVWLEHLRLYKWAYVHFGTTPDRNIFKTLLLGGSVYVPRLRTLINAGAMGAKGVSEDDLKAKIAEFTQAGLAIPDSSSSKLTAGLEERFHWSWYIGASLRLYSF